MKKRWIPALVLALLLPVCACAQSAVVNNGADPAGMLNMRSAPSKDAQIVGKFYSGTPVEIVSDAGGGWSQVCIGNAGSEVTGYMMTSYLQPSSAVDARERRQVASPYGTPTVVLRDRPSNSYDAVTMLMVGDAVTVLGTAGDFRYVMTDSACVGCLAQGELK